MANPVTNTPPSVRIDKVDFLIQTTDPSDSPREILARTREENLSFADQSAALLGIAQKMAQAGKVALAQAVARDIPLYSFRERALKLIESTPAEIPLAAAAAAMQPAAAEAPVAAQSRDQRAAQIVAFVQQQLAQQSPATADMVLRRLASSAPQKGTPDSH